MALTFIIDHGISCKRKRITGRNLYDNGLRVEALSKTYKKYPFSINSVEDVIALTNISFEMEAGELLAILGHNGAGKTTFISVLTGMLDSTSGTASLFNMDIHD